MKTVGAGRIFCLVFLLSWCQDAWNHGLFVVWSWFSDTFVVVLWMCFCSFMICRSNILGLERLQAPSQMGSLRGTTRNYKWPMETWQSTQNKISTNEPGSFATRKLQHCVQNRVPKTPFGIQINTGASTPTKSQTWAFSFPLLLVTSVLQHPAIAQQHAVLAKCLPRTKKWTLTKLDHKWEALSKQTATKLE